MRPLRSLRVDIVILLNLINLINLINGFGALSEFSLGNLQSGKWPPRATVMKRVLHLCHHQKRYSKDMMDEVKRCPIISGRGRKQLLNLRFLSCIALASDSLQNVFFLSTPGITSSNSILFISSLQHYKTPHGVSSNFNYSLPYDSFFFFVSVTTTFAEHYLQHRHSSERFRAVKRKDIGYWVN